MVCRATKHTVSVIVASTSVMENKKLCGIIEKDCLFESKWKKSAAKTSVCHWCDADTNFYHWLQSVSNPNRQNYVGGGNSTPTGQFNHTCSV